eukprot:TRINITY_DN54102_c0_g1_i6.p2 TRINITY_DN54102_c0_g1~~TRINITY_DN54102_c0_g1_i6.p2  ORF type:complete len:230 (-),score=62.73 TRINITY_DN54102_c0_g1_i6:10-699(-)
MMGLVSRLSDRVEIILVVGIAFGYFIVGSLFAALVAEPALISAAHLKYLLVFEPMVALPLLGFLHLRGWRVQQFGMVPTAMGTLQGLVLAVAAWFAVQITMRLALGLLDADLGDPVQVEWGLPLSLVVAVSIVNPLFEEFFVVGYLVTAIRRRHSMWLAVNISVAVRLLYHLYQGPQALISIIPIGFAWTVWYAKHQRLWPLLVAHAIFEIGRAVQQECRDRSRMPSSA